MKIKRMEHQDGAYWGRGSFFIDPPGERWGVVDEEGRWITRKVGYGNDTEFPLAFPSRQAARRWLRKGEAG